MVLIENRVVSNILSCMARCSIVYAHCLLNVSCSACVRERAGPLKSSRKYEPLTQGDGLNPNHDGSSTERDVPNEFCALRNKSLSRERKQATFFLSVHSCSVSTLKSPATRKRRKWKGSASEELFIDHLIYEAFPFPRAGDQSEIH